MQLFEFERNLKARRAERARTTMSQYDPEDWMWERARALLNQSQRAHQRPQESPPPSSAGPTWEPAVDVLETDARFVVIAALPGVKPEAVTIELRANMLTIRGQRPLPDLFRRAEVRRLEIQFGRFLRRIGLPPGDYTLGSVQLGQGCAVIQIDKQAGTPPSTP